MSDLEELEQSILADIAATDSEQAIESVRVAALGKKGSISEKLKTLGAMSADERKVMGPAINGLKNRVSDAITERKAALHDLAIEARLAGETVDVTLPVRRSPAEAGRIHPISQVVDEITAIFSDMGFSIAEGPDIETDYYNFTALNFPEGHPAREMHDTFFFRPDQDGERKLLRTHTSPVQIHTMERHGPSYRIVIPGKTYRCDSDATHSPMFHQLEGLVVDKTTNVANLKWVLQEFCKTFFEVPHLNMRFRRLTSRSPSRAWKSTSSAIAPAPRSVSARAPTGWKSSVAEWSIPMCCVMSALIPMSIRDLPGASASTGWPC